jgi:uncharacterized protein
VTDENRARNAAEELARADECLKEAQVLADAQLHYGAASRAYYVVYHAARALLFSVGIETRTHRGLVALIGEHFVRTGRLSSEVGRLVSRMQRDREDADYAAGAVFTRIEGQEALRDAARFLAEVRRLLGGG